VAAWPNGLGDVSNISNAVLDRSKKMKYLSKLFENVPILTSLKMSPFSAVEFGWCCGTAVGPCGNCGKRFVLSKPLWESAL
jgi:hypothetical protein